MGATPSPRTFEDRSDEEEGAEQEQREQEEPGEEERVTLINDMNDLDLLPVGLRDLHLFDALRDPIALSRLVRRHADADPHEDHHQQGHHCYASTHVCLLVSRLTPRWRRDVKHS